MQPWENSKTEPTIVNQRECVVRSISRQSLTRLLKGYQQKDFESCAPRLWWEARSIRLKLQIRTFRAHALEGRLFRSAVAETLQDHEIRTEVLLECDAYPSVAARLKQSSDDVKRVDTRSRAISTGKGWTMARRPKARRACCVICAPVAAGIASTEAVALQFGLAAMKIRRPPTLIARRFGTFSTRSLQLGIRMRWIRASHARMRWRTGLRRAPTRT